MPGRPKKRAIALLETEKLVFDSLGKVHQVALPGGRTDQPVAPDPLVHQKTFSGKFADELEERLCFLLLKGTSLLGACKILGVNYNSVHTWHLKGQADCDAGKETRHAKFARSVDQALELFKLVATTRIANSAPSTEPRGLMWLLTKRFAKEFGDVQTVRIEDVREECFDVLERCAAKGIISTDALRQIIEEFVEHDRQREASEAPSAA